MTKFVKKINIFVALLVAALVLVGCQTGTPNDGALKITISGLQESYTFNTGDAFSQDILLEGVTVTDQNGKSYIENVEINGLSAIPLNEDGTLKQAGTHTLRLNVVVDGNAVSTKMITVEVKFVMIETNDIIYNGDFATGTVDPFVNTNVDGGVSTMEVVDNQLVLSIEALSWQAAFPRIDYGAVDSESRFALEDGKFYEVSFDAKATVARHIHVQVGQLFAADPWFADALPVQQYFLLSTEMENYSFRFQADASRADLSVLSLLFGHGTLPSPYVSEACDVIYDNIKIVEVDSLGADTMAPSISAADKSIYVGTELDVLSLATISDDQDANPQVTVEITKDGTAVEAVDTSVAGVYNIKYTAKDVAGNESSKEIVLTIKDKPTTSMPIENGDEAASVANGGWVEWHDQNWVGSNVAVSEALVGPSELKLSFQYTSGTNWFGMQLFYTDSAIAAGAINIVMDVNSSVAGKVTIAGQVVELAVGDNHLEIAGNTSSSGATLSWQFGVLDDQTNLEGGTFVVSNLVINDTVVIGEGAATAGFDLAFLEEKNAVATPGTIGYWNDQWWCGSNVTVSQAHYQDGTLSISYLMDGFCSFGFQIFLDDASVAVGESKVVTMKIVADTAGTITVCGTVVELVAGENNIEVTATKADENALFEIIFGDTVANTAISGGTFVISECSLFDVIVAPTPEEPVQPEEPVVTDTIQNGEEAASVANPGVFIEWHDQGWCGSTVTVNKATYADGVLTLSYAQEGTCWFGMQLFYTDASVAAGSIKVSMNINSSVAGSMTIAGQIVELVVGENKVEITGTTASATLSIQFGVQAAGTSIAAGDFVITDIQISAAEAVEPETPVVPEGNVLPLIETGAKIEGAGIWLYFDNSVLNVQGSTEKVLSAKVTIDGAEVAVNDCFLSDWNAVAENTVRIYTVLGAAPVAEQVTVINISMTIAGVEYVAVATFNGSSLVSIA